MPLETNENENENKKNGEEKMAKKYSVTQIVNLNGTKVSRSTGLYMDQADAVALAALLEGEISIKEEISKTGNPETLVTNANFVSKIIMSGYDDVSGGRESSVISTFDKKAMIFKNTVSPDDIRAVLANAKPFKLLPASKPSTISVSGSERVNQA